MSKDAYIDKRKENVPLLSDIMMMSGLDDDEIALNTGISKHLVQDIRRQYIGGKGCQYKWDSKVLGKAITKLMNWFQPFIQEQKSLEKRNENICKEQNILLNKSAYKSNSCLGGIEYEAKYNEVINPVKFLIYDIEVSTLIGTTYNTWNANIIEVLKEQDLLSFAYLQGTIDKDHSIYDFNEDDIKCFTLDDVNRDSKELVKKLRDLIHESDIVCGFNNRRFDDKMVNSFILREGLQRPQPYKSFDLYSCIKNTFKFSRYGLDNISKLFGEHGKTEIGYKNLDLICGLNHDVVYQMNPTLSIYRHGDVYRKPTEDEIHEAFKLMKEYNKQDVKITYKVLKRVLSHLNNVPYNLQAMTHIPFACVRCGSVNPNYKLADRMKYTKAGAYHEYECSECGSYASGRFQDIAIHTIDGEWLDLRPLLK